MKSHETYLCSTRNVPLKMNVPVTRIHPKITRLHKRKRIQIVFTHKSRTEYISEFYSRVNDDLHPEN